MRHKKGCFSCEAGFRGENYFVFPEESDSNRYLSVKFSFKHIDGKVSKLVSVSMKHVFEKYFPNNTKMFKNFQKISLSFKLVLAAIRKNSLIF